MPEPASAPHVDGFVESLRKRRVSARTLTAYRSDIVKFFDYLLQRRTADESNLLENLQPREIERYIRGLASVGAKYSTIKRSVIVLRVYFGFLQGTGIIPSNPAALIKVAQAPQDVLSLSKLASIFRYLRERQQTVNQTVKLRYDRDELIIVFMVIYGVRQYQIPSLKLSSIQQNGEALALVISEQCSIKLSGDLLGKLREYLTNRNSNADLLFTEPLTNKPVTSMSVQSLLRELSQVLGFPCTTLSLYHTFLHLRSNPDQLKKVATKIAQFHSGYSRYDSSIIDPANRTSAEQPRATVDSSLNLQDQEVETRA